MSNVWLVVRLEWRSMQPASVWHGWWRSCPSTCWWTEPSTSLKSVRRVWITGQRPGPDRSGNKTDRTRRNVNTLILWMLRFFHHLFRLPFRSGQKENQRNSKSKWRAVNHRRGRLTSTSQRTASCCIWTKPWVTESYTDREIHKHTLIWLIFFWFPLVCSWEALLWTWTWQNILPWSASLITTTEPLHSSSSTTVKTRRCSSTRGENDKRMRIVQDQNSEYTRV